MLKFFWLSAMRYIFLVCTHLNCSQNPLQADGAGRSPGSDSWNSHIHVMLYLTLWRPEKKSSPINLKFLPHPDYGKWSLSPFEVDFFRTTVTEIQYWGFLTNWDISATFLLVKNHQFGIICNFRKSLKNGQNYPKI